MAKLIGFRRRTIFYFGNWTIVRDWKEAALNLEQRMPTCPPPPLPSPRGDKCRTLQCISLAWDRGWIFCASASVCQILKKTRGQETSYIFFSSLAKNESIVFWGSYCQFSLSMFVIRLSISMKEATRKIL